jgi:3-ketosteroid 9alpha-monooxygenase subunit B
VTEPDEVVRRHGYHLLRVKGVVHETDDARSFVLDIPGDLQETFRYRPGQFCTFRVHVDEVDHARCYSMSSAPDTDGDLTVTVKRVPGGVVSNWLIDHVHEGDRLEVSRPSGTFCVEQSDRPVIGFCGGSGVTPVMSITKSLIASSPRLVSLLYANRDPSSVIFDEPLAALRDRYGDRFELHRHFDSDGGFLDPAAVVEFVDGRVDAHFYICGPGPFMDLVEETLLGLGVAPDAIFIERFVTAGQTAPPPLAAADADADADDGVPESIVLILRGKKNEVPYRAGDTVLETARRANLQAPFSCEAGNCATCMALVQVGAATMRANNALTPDEVEEGWVLTCQAVPTGASVTVEYEPL